MDTKIFELEKDFGKFQFQQELSRWFESRGIITDLRSHLRYLMVMALQSTHVGVKPTNGSSPKAQALNLIVAEYLLKHSCHYTLSVFTSEVPTLANFNPGVLREGRRSNNDKKLSEGVVFRDNDIEEIFNALGMASCEEELTLLKARYLEKGEGISLVELFFQAVVEMSAKLQIRQNLESLAIEDGKRLLSEKWSTNVADILLSEKMAPPQISAIEEAIFRITEREIRRILEEERRLEMQMLASRERRIQEYLRKHEDDILLRLVEAEKDLTTRKVIIEKELTERQKHLTRMAVEWNNKHEELLMLSKNFHDIENENRNLKKKLKELEEENSKLKSVEETQNRTIEDFRKEVNSLISKLKEVTDANGVLSERIQLLISRENKEMSVCQEDTIQETARASVKEIPLLWSRNTAVDAISSNRHNKECEARAKPKELPVKIQTVSLIEEWNTKPLKLWNDIESKKNELNSNSSEDQDEVLLSSSSEEIIVGIRKKLQDLEEKTNSINQNYLEYKLKWISSDSGSESLGNQSDKPFPSNNEKPVIKETKFCQTDTEDAFTKIQKLEERKERNGFVGSPPKKLEELSPKEPVLLIPTKRQLQNRDFFLKSRQLLHELENQKLDDLQAATPSILESPTFSSGDELTRSFSRENKKSPEKSIILTPLRTVSFYYNNEPEAEKPSEENVKYKLSESSNLSKVDIDCLALLEEARIKSPHTSTKKPLRQQILLS